MTDPVVHKGNAEIPGPPSSAENTPRFTQREGLSAQLIPQLASVLKVLGWLVILAFVIVHWSYFGKWFNGATHVEFPGVKIDRFVEASAKVEANAKSFKARASEFDLDFAKGAIARAERVSPAINGSLVLWVDDDPSRNKLEMEILGDLGIRFVTALSTQEAMRLLNQESYDNYDLIISNVGRDEPTPALTKCPVHFFALRNNLQPNLSAFNNYVNSGTRTGFGGFGLMERIQEQFGDKHLPIIFFTGSSGGIVTSLCTNTVTNRVDILLQSVVSSLEERRWQQLDADTEVAESPQ